MLSSLGALFFTFFRCSCISRIVTGFVRGWCFAVGSSMWFVLSFVWIFLCLQGFSRYCQSLGYLGIMHRHQDYKKLTLMEHRHDDSSWQQWTKRVPPTFPLWNLKSACACTARINILLGILKSNTAAAQRIIGMGENCCLCKCVSLNVAF